MFCQSLYLTGWLIRGDMNDRFMIKWYKIEVNISFEVNLDFECYLNRINNKK